MSTAGGAQVRWSDDGKEIFYVAPDGKMMAVAVTLTGAAPKLAVTGAVVPDPPGNRHQRPRQQAAIRCGA